MEQVERLPSHLWRGIRRHPFQAVSVVGLVGVALNGLGAWDTVSPRVVWINDALTAKLGPGWQASMIDAWWFKVICLLIAGWLLFRIGSLSQQAEQRAGKEIAAISASLAEREAALLMRAMEIPSRMAQY